MEQSTNQFSPLCSRLADIIGGKGKVENGVCMISVERKDIQATIAGLPFHSIEHMFNIEMPSVKGESLITGEMVLLENEVPGITSYLTSHGIVVSAIHSHWLFDKPKLMYIHILDVTDPLKFAEVISGVIKK